MLSHLLSEGRKTSLIAFLASGILWNGGAPG